jgi:hypothetical protein
MQGQISDLYTFTYFHITHVGNGRYPKPKLFYPGPATGSVMKVGIRVLRRTALYKLAELGNECDVLYSERAKRVHAASARG